MNWMLLNVDNHWQERTIFKVSYFHFTIPMTNFVLKGLVEFQNLQDEKTIAHNKMCEILLFIETSWSTFTLDRRTR